MVTKWVAIYPFCASPEPQKTLKRPGARGIGPGGQNPTFFDPFLDPKSCFFEKKSFYGKTKKIRTRHSPGLGSIPDGSFCGPRPPISTNPGSETTNLGSDTTNPEQNFVLEPSGWLPESKTAIFGPKISKIVPGSGSMFRIWIRRGPRGPFSLISGPHWGPRGPKGPTKL